MSKITKNIEKNDHIAQRSNRTMKDELKISDNGFDVSDLTTFKVISRLEVGPITVVKNRISAKYKVVPKNNTKKKLKASLTNNENDTIDFIYKFEEDVFDPKDAQSLNLASMMLAQVAINYAMFCDEIRFIGYFDNNDKDFIKSMAKNTAREIFVKKILEDNPFIISPFSKMRPIKLSNYSQAKFKFVNQVSKILQEHVNWQPDNNKFAVLSSGGKDSLLSFGLLRELGVKTHPIFVNESGRHWFTALNAYRYFSKTIPKTGRVWTNSDRVFNWMIRHLPFVRKDFAHLRSDEYPIRLWTVAIFIFAVIPILKKRGIGNLVIGDEFDTTDKKHHQGITNYNGLYDQSKYFDIEMSKYYTHKGWNFVQFSILRPLSEMLIEKVLLERYPKLLTHQISCHAAHLEGEIVKPCGRCEKCRRIVGMLSALGGDPTVCGYSKKQIESCLKDIKNKGVYQELEGVQHLGFLLKEKGLIDKPYLGKIAIRKCPEILSLRFDSARSSVKDIPVILRTHLYHILLEHGIGSLKKVGHAWKEFSPLSSPDIFRTGSFEKAEETSTPPLMKRLKFKKDENYLLSTLSWPEAKERLKLVDIAILPVGAIEQHGRHLPLDTDAFDAEYLAHEVAAECSEPKPIVLPLIPYGVSYHHHDFPGTISISPETLSKLTYDIGLSAAHHGVKKLVILNGHGGNTPALQFAAQMINRDTSIFTCVDTGETSDTDVSTLIETPNDVHAGEIETSTTLAVRPEVVRVDEMRKFIPRFSSRFLDFSSKRSVEWYARTVKISPTGVLGDPTKANPQKGERIWSMMIQRLVEFVEDLKGMTLEEIYQRRY
jgi:creatinine amidohydrolase/Fe(II)-dependent formamide hydrolase-like protein